MQEQAQPRQTVRTVRTVQVATNVVPSGGGTPTAVSDFLGAMGGTVISFTEPDLIPHHARPSVLHVPMLRGAPGRIYGWSTSERKRAAARLLLDAELVIVHGLFRYHAQWASAIARREGIPYWVVPHGVLHPYVFSYRRWQKSLWMRLVGGPMIGAAARTVYATTRERQTALDYAPTKTPTVVPWPMARLAELGRAAARDKVRRRFGIPSEDRILLFLGRIDVVKRVLETIEAFHISDASHLHLLIVGPESASLTRSDCERYIAGLGAQRVHFAPATFGTEKDDLLLASDAFISLSHRENFGYTVAEALAARLPVILSPGIDLTPELSGHDCGWLLRTLERDEAVAALRDFAQLPDARLTEFGRNGRRWVEQNLAPERFARVIQELAWETLAVSADRGASP
jgi:glycosyltransferase involved in cell wall biosynthesis